MKLKFWEKKKQKFEGRITRQFEEFGGTQTDHATILKVYRYFKTDPILRLTVKTNTNYSVGDGYYLITENEDNTINQTRKKIVETFLLENNFEDFIHQVTQEMWLTGNSFFHFKGANIKDIQGLQIIPQTSISEIRRDPMGNVTEYIQQRDSYVSISPDQLFHFSRDNEDASAWGTGIGQPYVTQGAGYIDQTGDQVVTPSLAVQAEMLRYITTGAIYNGSPRHVVTAMTEDPEALDDITSKMSKLKPNQSFVSSTDFEVKTMSHSGEVSFDPFLDYMRTQITLAMQSPVPSMFPEPSNFAYASAKESSALMFPGIDSYQRSLTQMIEQNIFKPLLERESPSHSWDKFPVRIVWGKEDNTVDETAIFQLLNAKLSGAPITWESLFEILQEQGFPVQQSTQTSMSPEEAKQWALNMQERENKLILNRIMKNFE